jgi:hypothetical protein
VNGTPGRSRNLPSGHAGDMEHSEESGVGYPEEQPAEVVDDPQPPSEEKPQRKGGRADRDQTGSGGDDEGGTATGNPHAAGS